MLKRYLIMEVYFCLSEKWVTNTERGRLSEAYNARARCQRPQGRHSLTVTDRNRNVWGLVLSHSRRDLKAVQWGSKHTYFWILSTNILLAGTIFFFFFKEWLTSGLVQKSINWTWSILSGEQTGAYRMTGLITVTQRPAWRSCIV